MARAEKVANLSPLKQPYKLPAARFNFGLDADERKIVQANEELSKQEIWALLEKKRFEELQRAAIGLTGKLLVQNRCPKCTLEPPCKHFR